MKYSNYLKDSQTNIITQIISSIVISIFLIAVNTNVEIIVMLLFSWFLIMTIHLNTQYYIRNHYLNQLLSLFSALDEKYLIAEVMERPVRADDMVYYDILKSANKSMMEQISHSKYERKEYKEYIEQWIHDIKTPIAAMQLVCENNKSDITRKLLIELEKISRYTEQALYYARSENVEKDYLIKEVLLSDIVHDAIAENKQILLQNHVAIQMDGCEQTIYSDEKWIGFILNQLIINSVKYSPLNPALTFLAQSKPDKVTLSVTDNGMGISECNLPRIFDKGFTGDNGRIYKYSTGIGLYLCRQLCNKLGIGIAAEAKVGEGTTITLIFPKGGFVKVQE